MKQARVLYCFAVGYLFLVFDPTSSLARDQSGHAGTRAWSSEVFDTRSRSERKVDRIEYVVQPGSLRNYGGRLLRWTGEGDCNEDEGQKPMIEVQGADVTVRDAMFLDAPDGIHVNAEGAILERLIFPEICEDAIAANGADRLVIRDCAFRGASDKAIQLNSGSAILIENCYFERCAKPIRVKQGVTVTVRNCTAVDCVAFILADGMGARVMVEDNHVSNSKWFVKALNGAVIDVKSGNKTSRIRYPDQTGK